METKQYATKHTQWVDQEIKGKFKNTLRQMTEKTQPVKNLWDAQKLCLEGSS